MSSFASNANHCGSSPEQAMSDLAPIKDAKHRLRRREHSGKSGISDLQNNARIIDGVGGPASTSAAILEGRPERRTVAARTAAGTAAFARPVPSRPNHAGCVGSKQRRPRRAFPHQAGHRLFSVKMATLMLDAKCHVRATSKDCTG